MWRHLGIYWGVFVAVFFGIGISGMFCLVLALIHVNRPCAWMCVWDYDHGTFLSGARLHITGSRSSTPQGKLKLMKQCLFHTHTLQPGARLQRHALQTAYEHSHSNVLYYYFFIAQVLCYALFISHMPPISGLVDTSERTKDTSTVLYIV